VVRAERLSNASWLSVALIFLLLVVSSLLVSHDAEAQARSQKSPNDRPEFTEVDGVLTFPRRARPATPGAAARAAQARPDAGVNGEPPAGLDQTESVSPSRRDTIRLNVSRGQTIRLPRPAASVFVADPSIADIQTPSGGVIFVFGKRSGRTSLFALDEQGRAIAQQQVVVVQPVEDLRALLRSELGDYKIDVDYTPNGAVLSGNVPNAAAAESARSLVLQFLGQGATVSNRLRVAGSLQIMLHVRVAEISRDVAKEFGFNINATTASGNFSFGLLNGGNGSANAGRLSAGFNAGNTNLSVVLNALAAEGLVSILAEPTLTTTSGEPASFLAGGEFPIPVVGSTNGTTPVVSSVQFKRFGVSLEFIPTVLSGDLISVRVRPEVSDISSRGAVSINGFNIPAISTRRADTSVELGSGQSFAIGGLIRQGFSTQVSQFPILGDLPILGTLFRSSQFQKNESELVIIVTPYLVRPGTSANAMRVPTDRVAPPNDSERILLNRLARSPRGTQLPTARSPRTPALDPSFIVE
jgi:pilus assembly protein CpaC